MVKQFIKYLNVLDDGRFLSWVTINGIAFQILVELEKYNKEYTQKKILITHKCEKCGEEKGLIDLHHIVPLSELGRNSPINFIILCRKCHSAIHTGKLTINEKGKTNYKLLKKAKKIQRKMWNKNLISYTEDNFIKKHVAIDGAIKYMLSHHNEHNFTERLKELEKEYNIKISSLYA